MFLSQTFKAEQKRWSTADKECYAIVFAFKHLEHLIRDRYFILRTDHKNLTCLKLENSGKVRRWKLLIQEYNCGIEHVAGVYNFVADDFSRMIPPDIREEISSKICTSSVVTSSIDADLSNPATDSPKEEAMDDNKPQPDSSPLIDDHDITLSSTSTIIAPLIAEELCLPRDKYKFISSVHNSGVDKTYERLIAQGHKWPQMRTHIHLFITKHCPCYQKIAVNKIY